MRISPRERLKHAKDKSPSWLAALVEDAKSIHTSPGDLFDLVSTEMPDAVQRAALLNPSLPADILAGIAGNVRNLREIHPMAHVAWMNPALEIAFMAYPPEDAHLAAALAIRQIWMITTGKDPAREIGTMGIKWDLSFAIWNWRNRPMDRDRHPAKVASKVSQRKQEKINEIERLVVRIETVLLGKEAAPFAATEAPITMSMTITSI